MALGSLCSIKPINQQWITVLLLLEVMGFVVGDVLGLVFCLISIVYLFRMIRFIKIIPDK